MRKSTERKMNLIVLAILAVNVVGGIGVVVRRFTSHQDLLLKGRVTLQTSPAPGVILCNVRTCAHPHEFVVTGHLESTDEHNTGWQGSITVAILSPQGAMLDRRSDRYVLSPSYKPAGMHFAERFRTIPPTGSVLRIEWDRPEQPSTQPTAHGTVTRPGP